MVVGPEAHLEEQCLVSTEPLASPPTFIYFNFLFLLFLLSVFSVLFFFLKTRSQGIALAQTELELTAILLHLSEC